MMKSKKYLGVSTLGLVDGDLLDGNTLENLKKVLNDSTYILFIFN